MYAIHRQTRHWQLMTHGNAFIQYLDESGDRGSNQFGSINWAMAMARRSLGRGAAEFRETGSGNEHRYRARFWPSDAARLRDLFQIVGRADATEVLVDDRPVPYARELWLPLVWFLIPR